MDTKRYILALDQGTTSSRAILFDRAQRIVGSVQREFPQLYPREGWVEHDPMEIYASQSGVMLEVLTRHKIDPAEVAAIGIANQRETTVIWERKSGHPVYPAIVWQCRRTAPMIDRLIADGLSEKVRAVTGLIPDAYFSGSKIAWILDQVPGVRAQAEAGELAFGTIDSWLIYNLTGGTVHRTDLTNASRTMLFDIHKRDWDQELLDWFRIPRALLPQVCDSSDDFGTTRLLGAEIPIRGVAGDQQAALFGHGCFDQGEAKNTYGTGCFLLLNTGDVPIASRHGLLTTIAYGLGGSVRYALEGSVFVAGAVMQWLRDELRFFSEARDAQYHASKVEDTGGVYLVPAFTGLGAPWWDMYARGCLIGMTRGTRREHIIRAAEESIAYQSLDLIRAMEQDTGYQLSELRVDGGASRDAFLMQFQADIADLPLRRPLVTETTALGAASLAGLATGFWRDLEELKSVARRFETYEPAMPAERRRALTAGWAKAVGRSLNWAEPDA